MDDEIVSNFRYVDIKDTSSENFDYSFIFDKDWVEFDLENLEVAINQRFEQNPHLQSRLLNTNDLDLSYRPSCPYINQYFSHLIQKTNEVLTTLRSQYKKVDSSIRFGKIKDRLTINLITNYNITLFKNYKEYINKFILLTKYIYKIIYKKFPSKKKLIPYNVSKITLFNIIPPFKIDDNVKDTTITNPTNVQKDETHNIEYKRVIMLKLYKDLYMSYDWTKAFTSNTFYNNLKYIHDQLDRALIDDHQYKISFYIFVFIVCNNERLLFKREERRYIKKLLSSIEVINKDIIVNGNYNLYVKM
jgi:hypothetical protein